uniref:Ig-like domain-containing protein n=1 Tax=Neolamprologus brichardi TaxID=32507 RepID=A0A3Q4G9U9_NEOBR
SGSSVCSLTLPRKKFHDLPTKETLQIYSKIQSATKCYISEVYLVVSIYWYKQNVGETLKLILALYKNTPPEYGPEFSDSRFNVNNDKNFSNLIILKTIQEDEGIYHCG